MRLRWPQLRLVSSRSAVRLLGRAAFAGEALGLVLSAVSITQSGDLGAWGLGGWLSLVCFQLVLSLLHALYTARLVLHPPHGSAAALGENTALTDGRVTSYAVQVAMAATLRLVLVASYFAQRVGHGSALDSPVWTAITSVICNSSLLCMHAWAGAEAAEASVAYDIARKASPPPNTNTSETPPKERGPWG